MEEKFLAFTIWAIMGLLFIIMGIYCMKSRKTRPFGFWANVDVIQVKDVKGYNCALGKLWCVYGVLFTVIGLPLLSGQNSGRMIVTMLGTMFISIGAMVVYVVGIEGKYRKKIELDIVCRMSFYIGRNINRGDRKLHLVV